jgi:hypothetical protein
VPNNLGANHLTRQEWIEQNNFIPKQLFNVGDDELMFIADGTYIYCQKSKYNTLQRKQYSMQKNRHLVKPFVICTTTGKIVDIFGLFPATDNDAKIIETILKSNDEQCKEFRTLLQPNDHIILDRGFRDSISTLENKYKLKTHMPTCLVGKQKQLTTYQANTSRFVTKSRNIVEVLNGRLKTRFRANDKIHANVTLQHTMQDLRISASLLNRFSENYVTDRDNETTIVNNMMAKLNTNNRLESMFLEQHIDKKRTVYEKLHSGSIKNFPKLDNSTIINTITLGTYQLKQAASYIHENFDENGDKTIEIFADNSNLFGQNTHLIRTRIQSRHSNSTKYNSYITYSSEPNDNNPIKDWYCTCKSGKRTVGTCSHVASVIYYLSNARYNSTKSGKFNIDKVFPEYVSRESNDESDDSGGDNTL